jgi:hypothetical protein
MIGACQVGKTILARQIARSFPGPMRQFDLESPEDLHVLRDPMLVLRDLSGLAIVDGISTSVIK